MSYTNPYGQPQGVAKRATNILREILIAEIVAINGYQQHIANTNIEALKEVWHHIMLDEKKHYGWILKLLRKYDPAQQKGYLLAAEEEKAASKSPMQSYTPNYDRQIILNNLREDIKGELEAVVLYEQELMNLPHRDMVTTLQKIIDEEKEHAEHLTAVLLKYDRNPYNDLT